MIELVVLQRKNHGSIDLYVGLRTLRNSFRFAKKMVEGKKIVIVDDDENLQMLLSSIFQSQSYDTEVLKTGKEAMDYLMNEANAPAILLLILDRMLPDMDGMDILRAFREKYGDKIPVLILSMLSSEKDVLEGLDKGAVEYVAKPFSVNILLKKAQMLIQQVPRQA